MKPAKLKEELVRFSKEQREGVQREIDKGYEFDVTLLQLEHSTKDLHKSFIQVEVVNLSPNRRKTVCSTN